MFRDVRLSDYTSTDKRYESESTASQPQLNGLRLKVKIIRSSGKGRVSWFGVRRAIKPEDTGRGDEFALHFRIGICPGKRPLRNEIDYLLIAEQDIRSRLAP